MAPSVFSIHGQAMQPPFLMVRAGIQAHDDFRAQSTRRCLEGDVYGVYQLAKRTRAALEVAAKGATNFFKYFQEH